MEEFKRRGEGAGRWGCFLFFLGNTGPPFLPSRFPPPHSTRHSHVQAEGETATLGAGAGSAAQGCSWLALWLALLKARAVNSALLKKSNKGKKKRKEKGKWGRGGSTGWEWGRQGLREQVGTI